MSNFERAYRNRKIKLGLNQRLEHTQFNVHKIN